MTFERIQELTQYIPEDSEYCNEILGHTKQITTVNKFIRSYKDVAFAYHFVKTLVDKEKPLPAFIDEPELYDTYQFLRYNAYKPNVVFAISLTHPSNKSMEDVIKAFIITDEPFDKLAEITGIPEEVIRLYEKLFFNVRDRKKEALFIANTVYPNTRMVELMDNYTRNEDFGKMLMRSAYNNGIEDAMYFSGLKIESFINSDQTLAVEMAKKLETAILANGYFIARNGYLNSKTSGIGHAKGLLIAAKQSGMDNSKEDTEGVAGTLGEDMMKSLLTIKGPEMEEKLELYKQIEESKQHD
jgi:hypothetical protein